jgi:hypothetical protein
VTTAYPGSIDDFSNPGPDTQRDATGFEHNLQHSNVNDAVEAIEAELGTDPAGMYATVKERLDAAEYTASLTSSHWTFKTGTADTDPGAGKFALNDTEKALTTAIYIDMLTAGGTDVSNFMPLLAANDNVFIQARDDASKRVRYSIVEEALAGSGYWKIPVSVDAAAGGEFSNNQDCLVVWTIGALGASGGASVWVGDDPPAAYESGDMWFDTNEPQSGVGAGNNDTLWKPYGTAVYADEFNDATLDAGWTRVDQVSKVGYVTWTEGADVLSCVHTTGSDGAGEMHGLVRPVGTAFAPGDALVCAYTLAIAYTAQYCMMGIGVSNGTTWGTSTSVETQVYTVNGYAGPGQHRINVNAGMNADTDYSTGRFVHPVGKPLWLRFVMTSANNWRADYSPDGVGWVIGDSKAYTLTPTHMGFFVSNWVTATPWALSIECFRRYSGVA